MNPVRPVPQNYSEELAKVAPLGNPLGGVVKRAEDRNAAIVRQFEKAVGPVKGFQGVITRI